jgi:hypothetical protein
MDCSGRFSLSSDMNGDLAYTVTDLVLQLKWFFFAPGDALICLIGNDSLLGGFFEVSHYSLGNWFSGTVGGILWSMVLLIVWGRLSL